MRSKYERHVVQINSGIFEVNLLKNIDMTTNKQYRSEYERC